MTEPKVSVVILSFNGGNLLQRCVESVMNTSYGNFEVILVDNGSTDESIKNIESAFGRDKRFRVIHNGRNYGFSRGNNIGAEHAKGEYLAFLNQDTVVDPSWLSASVLLLESNSEIGAVQSKLMSMRKKGLIDSAGVFINIFGMGVQIGYNEPDTGRYDRPYPITSGLAAALVIRKDAFTQVGGFDNDYFMLAEDGDLCWRLWLRGYSVYFCPQSIVYHMGATARSREGPAKNYYYTMRNTLITLGKNLQAQALIVVIPCTIGYYLFRGVVRRYGSDYYLSFCAALRWVSKNLSLILSKRASVNSYRRVSDRLLIKRRAFFIMNKEFLLRGF